MTTVHNLGEGLLRKYAQGVPTKGRPDLWTLGLLKSNKRLLGLKGRAKQRVLNKHAD